MDVKEMKIKSLFNQNEMPTINEYLRRCGIDNPIEYLNPSARWIESPMDYDNMDKAVTILEEAINSGVDNKIIIVCDCDCDGYCASTIAYQFLESQGVYTNDIIVLFHSGKQHGLDKKIVAEINTISAEYNISLLWIPDAGTNDVEQCEFYAHSMDIPILITDHHQSDKVNNGAVIVNNQISASINNKNLCGAGVTHKVITEFCKRHNSDFHKSVLDLVALATIGDVMDMREYENRLIVKWGISHITNPFLKAMCDKFIGDDDTTPTSLAWKVIPKINAVCRSDKDIIKEEMFESFVGEWEPEAKLKDIEWCHKQQKDKADIIYKSLLNKYTGDKVKIFITNSTPYTGLVAMKLSSYYDCPCIVAHNNNGFVSGSLRSPVPIKSLLQDSGYMEICAGHEESCGVGWYDRNTTQLSTYCGQLEFEDAEKTVLYSTDNIFIPMELFEMSDVGKSLWGNNIPEPVIHISNITINGADIKGIGSNKATIRFLYGDIQFIMFFCTKEDKKNMCVGIDEMLNMEVIGTPSINTFRGKDTKQIIIKEWEICQK